MSRLALRPVTGLALAALAAWGCAHPHPSTSRSTALTDIPKQTRDDNKQKVQALFATFNDGDLAAIDALVGPEYVGAQGDRGPAGFRAVVLGLRSAFPDLRYTIDDLLAEGDQVAVRWHWTGTHRAPFRAFPPTGKEVSNTGAGIFRLANGKIVSAVLETDRLGFLEQLGAVPPNAGRGPQPAAPSPRP